jgi:hypothetical protein
MSDGPSPGSGGNVLAALCSLFIPGLGQLLQGRILLAAFFFVLAGVVWAVSFGTLGWIVHIIAAISAALYRR